MEDRSVTWRLVERKDSLEGGSKSRVTAAVEMNENSAQSVGKLE